ncbi:hypothetical protein XHV734_0003 [Xanthomonas hortorum pv. vitians]|nr:hypothetical protein XHV734_0003 [Xanthomonas hortorum pv. vitians]
MKQQVKVVFGEIWPYHHHQALKLFLDLKAKPYVHKSKTHLKCRQDQTMEDTGSPQPRMFLTPQT